MSRVSLEGVLGQARKIAAVQTARGLADGELLRRFVAASDEAAFAALVDRHGPRVLGVCRRALLDRHHAEDAFQATFLVLARKAASVRDPASLPGWLHRVACTIAANARRARGRRQRHERGAAPAAPVDTAAEVTWREVRTALDEELGRLPERYRGPLILCYLDGLTRDEAAGRLGLTPGCLHGRLERGRELLRGRLARRGLALSAALGAAALGGAARAALPPSIVLSTARAAALVAGGQPVTQAIVSAEVLGLTREVLTGMFH